MNLEIAFLQKYIEVEGIINGQVRYILMCLRNIESSVVLAGLKKLRGPRLFNEEDIIEAGLKSVRRSPPPS
jgi:hypothetical protein